MAILLTVNGAYGPWSAWSLCTMTCGGGVQSHSRQCNDPPPGPDGLPCDGLSNDTQDCNVDKCPGRLMYRVDIHINMKQSAEHFKNKSCQLFLCLKIVL